MLLSMFFKIQPFLKAHVSHCCAIFWKSSFSRVFTSCDQYCGECTVGATWYREGLLYTGGCSHPPCLLEQALCTPWSPPQGQDDWERRMFWIGSDYWDNHTSTLKDSPKRELRKQNSGVRVQSQGEYLKGTQDNASFSETNILNLNVHQG